MKILILGAGLQGVACAWDLIRSPNVESVMLADQSQSALDAAKAKLNSPKVQTTSVEVTSPDQVLAVMQPADVVISAVPYFFNETLMPLAIEAKCHWVDMGGNTDLVLRQMEYSDKAKAAGVTMVPDMGLAPGFANLLAAELIEKFDEVESVKIRVGGLPQNPKPPLDYQLFFSIEGLVNEYIGLCEVLRNGKPAQVQSLTEIESIEFSDPIGKCEAFHTLGGSSTLPLTYEGKVRDLDYKTVRYPGHAKKIRLLSDLGLFDTESVVTRDGVSIEPRQVTAAVLNKLLKSDDPRDYVVIRVEVEGTKGEQSLTERFECIDQYDEDAQLTAMMRTTAFPVAIVAELLGSGLVTTQGVFPPERVVPVGAVREAMIQRGIEIRHEIED